ncbi:MAG TPA: hypothetical protein VG273_16360 [Bryobacteraceae bacterium]|jgi:hypothetical protein|nr:hypothetical protein [Bryobacteraceae bacterium]
MMPQHEYQRPDLVVFRSMVASADQIREELKAIGDNEKRYPSSLRVVRTQSQLITKLAEELLRRFEIAGSGAEGSNG